MVVIMSMDNSDDAKYSNCKTPEIILSIEIKNIFYFEARSKGKREYKALTDGLLQAGLSDF